MASHPFKKDGVCNTLRLRSARPTTGVGRPGFQKVLPHTISALKPGKNGIGMILRGRLIQSCTQHSFAMDACWTLA